MSTLNFINPLWACAKDKHVTFHWLQAEQRFHLFWTAGVNLMLNQISFILWLWNLSKVKVPYCVHIATWSKCPGWSCESGFNFLMATDDMMMMIIMICELYRITEKVLSVYHLFRAIFLPVYRQETSTKNVPRWITNYKHEEYSS